MKISLLLLPTLALSGAIARADLAYTQTTSSPFAAMMGGGAAASNVTTKIYSKGTSNRSEAQIFGRKMITVANGAGKVIQIDPATKTYAISTGGAAGIAKSMMAGSKAKMPKMDMTVTTKKLAPQKIRGIMAPHYMVMMNMKMGTPRGPQNMKMGMEIWGSNVAVPMMGQSSANAMKNLPDTFKTMFGSGAGIKGDLKGMAAAFKTVPLRMKMTMNGMALSTTETSAISTKPLPASLFAIPRGYRAVSSAQFAQMQQAAMRKSMAAMTKNMPGTPRR